MTVEMGDTDKQQVLVEDAKSFRMQFELPDVNRGNYRFEPISNDTIRYSLGAIKGTGEQAILSIVQERETNGPYNSFFDFMRRIDRQRVNKRTIEALIRAGAFDSLQLNRASLLASVDIGLSFAAAQEANANQGGLFDSDEDDTHASHQEPALVHATPWDTRAQLAQEKLAIGFYLSGHLFDAYALEVRQFIQQKIADLQDSRDQKTIVGIVRDMRMANTARGKMLLCKLDDKSGAVDIAFSASTPEAQTALVKEDELLVLQGACREDRFSGGLRFNAQQIWDLAGARLQFAKYLQVSIQGASTRLPNIAALLREFPPQTITQDDGYTSTKGVPVRLRIQGGDCKGEIDLGAKGRFYPSDAALAAWMLEAEGGQAKLVYVE